MISGEGILYVIDALGKTISNLENVLLEQTKRIKELEAEKEEE